MEQKEACRILGLEKLSDFGQIRQQYLMKLKDTNPEDKPQELQQLRTAYETALKYADAAQRKAAADSSIKTEHEPIRDWLENAETIYADFDKRKDVLCWEKLFAQEICVGLDTYFAARTAFCIFLNYHPYLSAQVWRLIEKTFHITEILQEESEEAYELLDALKILGEELSEQVYNALSGTPEFDIAYMTGSQSNHDGEQADGYINAYLQIRKDYECSRRLHREHFKKLEELCQYGYESLYVWIDKLWLLYHLGEKKEAQMMAGKICSDSSAYEWIPPALQAGIVFAQAVCAYQKGDFLQSAAFAKKLLDYTQNNILWAPGNTYFISRQQMAAYAGKQLLTQIYSDIISELQNVPQNEEKQFLLAEAYLNVENTDAALQLVSSQPLKQSVIQNKRQTELFILTADILYAMKDWEACIHVLDNLDQILSKNRQAYQKKWGADRLREAYLHNLYLLSECFLASRDYESAFLYAEVLIEEDQSCYQAYRVHQQACFWLYRSRKAVKDYNYAVSLCPKDWKLYAGAAAALLRLHRFEDAERLSEYAAQEFEEFQVLSQKFGLAENPENSENLENPENPEEFRLTDLEYILFAAEKEMAAGRYEKALEFLEPCQTGFSDIVQEVPALVYDLAVCMEQLGHVEEAVIHFKALYRRYQMYADVMLRLSAYHKQIYYADTFRKEEYQTALQYLTEAAAAQENENDYHAMMRLGQFYLEGMEFEKGLEVLQKIPRYAAVRFYIGECFLRLYREKIAEQFYEEAIATGIDNFAVYFQNAEAKRRTKDYEAAALCLQTALADHPDRCGQVYCAMGDLYLFMQQPKQAVSYYDMLEAIPEMQLSFWKRRVYYALSQEEFAKALELAGLGMKKLAQEMEKAAFAVFAAEQLRFIHTEAVLAFLQEGAAILQQQPETAEKYKMLMRVHTQRMSVFFALGKRDEMKKAAGDYMESFHSAYPQAKWEDYLVVKQCMPKRQEEAGWYYLAAGNEFLAVESFKRQWGHPTMVCLHCRGRVCFKGYLNEARYYESIKDYNRAIYFYKEVLNVIPMHIEAAQAVKRLYKIPKKDR